MAWLRAGTVAVITGSTTVTGTNTGFAANTRVGDAFIGPDGRQYELQNVASDTVISLASPYLGPTAAGQPYAVMPVQGYQKLLADQVRDWTGQYGQKMAALGTTGNYDVLPVTKGGTGGTDQAGARAGLGLGTAATANITTSALDSAQGHILKVGDFGLGLGAVEYPTVSVNTVAPSGEYLAKTANTGTPYPAWWGIRVSRAAGNYYRQTAWNLNTPYDEYSRTVENGTPGAWAPRDAVVVTNANGTATKFPDGTMICRAVFEEPLNIHNQYGAAKYGTSSWTYPARFLAGSNPSLHANARNVGTLYLSTALSGPGVEATVSCDFCFVDVSSFASNYVSRISYLAVGRWK